MPVILDNHCNSTCDHSKLECSKIIKILFFRVSDLSLRVRHNGGQHILGEEG